MNNESAWINDPALEAIDQTKLIFLEKLINQSKNIKNNQKEMLPFLLSLSKLSKENNISFTKEDVELIYSVIEKKSSPEDISKMKQLSSFFHFQ